MFWSKIWFFLIAVAAAVTLAIAIVLPRPAQRVLVNEEHRRLAVACGVIDILMADDARGRVDLAGSFARSQKIVEALEGASAAANLDETRMKTVRGVADDLMKTITGTRKPDWAILVDKKGRVVARVHIDENDPPGEVLAGRPLVDDALAGYMRDDLWTQNGTMYLVSASPVVKRDAPVDYVGAVVLGHQVTNDLAAKLVGSLDVDIAFFLGGDPVAANKSVLLDQAALQDAYGKLKGPDVAHDCQTSVAFPLRAGNEDFTGIVARLPGEAGQKKAFFSVYIKRPIELGFTGTLKVVTKGDLSFANFPWILLVIGFLIALGGGVALMLIEADRPLRRLAADAVKLAKGERERLAEDAHPGKFGSIARSVNIHIDKLGREAKSAKKDMDQLLGPAPEGSLGTIDLLASPLPSVRPGGPAPAVPPPPSEFRFSDSGSQPAARITQPRAATPPPVRQSGAQPQVGGLPGATPPRAYPPQAPPSALSLDDDILGGGSGPSTLPPQNRAPDPYFKQVFDQFLALKKSCNEPTSGLTYEKFTEKLIKNRDDLMTKTGCREVRFTVYVKDGKAALKATPVKDE